jgi:hypothetical protein
MLLCAAGFWGSCIDTCIWRPSIWRWHVWQQRFWGEKQQWQETAAAVAPAPAPAAAAMGQLSIQHACCWQMQDMPQQQMWQHAQGWSMIILNRDCGWNAFFQPARLFQLALLCCSRTSSLGASRSLLPGFLTAILSTFSV